MGSTEKFLVKDIITKGQERLVVTQRVAYGGSMRMSWVPEKPGNWLFHCHLVDHVLPLTFLRDQEAMNHASMKLENHASNGMGGLMMGISIIPDKKYTTSKTRTAERKLTLVIGEKQNYFDNSPGKGFQVWENGKATTAGVTIPGPPLVLVKDQPVAIKIVNTLKEPTTIHWHGLEIDSYYDGVAGWGNKGKRLAPLIQPGGSFTVHITPPRAGTFMYHTHMHDLQLLQGMYGALIVLNASEKYDPDTDKIFLISQGGSGISMPKTFPRIRNDVVSFGKTKALLNGTDKPEPIYLQTGQTYRFRFINIAAQNFQHIIRLRQNDQDVSWKRIAKDGMTLPKDQQIAVPSIQLTMPGETYDFEFKPQSAGDYQLIVKHPIDADPPITQLIKVKD